MGVYEPGEKPQQFVLLLDMRRMPAIIEDHFAVLATIGLVLVQH